MRKSGVRTDAGLASAGLAAVAAGLASAGCAAAAAAGLAEGAAGVAVADTEKTTEAKNSRMQSCFIFEIPGIKIAGGIGAGKNEGK